MDEQIAGHRGVPRWWPGDMVRLVDDTTRLRMADGSWITHDGGVTSRFPAVMTDDQVTEAVNHHYVSSPRDRWKALADEREAALATARQMIADVRAALADARERIAAGQRVCTRYASYGNTDPWIADVRNALTPTATTESL